MTAKIKLNAASGGGSFSIQAPSSSSNNRVFTLPDSADATLLTSTSATGKILQVKYTQSTFGVTATNSRTQLLTLSITLASASNPVYVIGQVHAGAQRNSNGYTMASIYRGTTYTEDLGDTELARGFAGSAAANYTYDSYTLVALDTGNTSTTQTYALTFGKGSTGTTSAETDARYSLTLMEVAA